MTARLIGVDVGGTKIAVATLESTRLSEPVLAATDTSSTEALIAQLVAIAAAGEAAAVGVAVPSVVDWETGRIRSSVNIPLQDIALRDVLREQLGVPVYVDNDATCAALAEAYDETAGSSPATSSCSRSAPAWAVGSSSPGASTAARRRRRRARSHARRRRHAQRALLPHRPLPAAGLPGGPRVGDRAQRARTRVRPRARPRHRLRARRRLCASRRSSCLDAASVWVSRMRSTRSTPI